jgi:hypothetical protein
MPSEQERLDGDRTIGQIVTRDFRLSKRVWSNQIELSAKFLEPAVAQIIEDFDPEQRVRIRKLETPRAVWLRAYRVPDFS